MIFKLQHKFIKICILSFLIVFAVLFSTIVSVTAYQTNTALDRLADIVFENGGKFPKHSDIEGRPQKLLEKHRFNREAPFTTRFFTVRISGSGEITAVDTQSVSSVSNDNAEKYAEEVFAKTKNKGWIDEFRYNIYDAEEEKIIVFIKGTEAKQTNIRFVLSTLIVLTVSNLIIIALIVIISKRAVAPIAESYEKQKQFVTDANHELKTPLTLIQTNLDILESDIGNNEWLSDIRAEAMEMTELVNQLVSLAHMDENIAEQPKQIFSMSEAVADTVGAFSPYVEKREKRLETAIAEGIDFKGDEKEIRRLVSILADNAVKYCDSNGVIRVALYKKRHITLTVDNDCSYVDSIELNKLFDRFYRADKARTFGSGSGIGLSIAKSIVEKHNGKIKAYNMGGSIIRFQVTL